MRKPSFYVIVLAVLSGGPAAWSQAVGGRVTTQSGVPIEHVRVERAGGGGHVFTDAEGVFALDDCPPPCMLLLSHPRFVEQAVEVAAGEPGPLEVVLEPKNVIYEQLVVSAARGAGDALSPQSVSSTMLHADEKPAPPATLTELAEGVAGVSENGQGGHFQVLSIRGISRHRVLTLISGMRMTSERRAGAATSFLDPLLMGTLDVVRGPASTYYGSGALGGVLQIFPRTFDGWSLEAGWDSHGDETYQAIGWGDGGGWSLGVARRDAGDGEDAAGGLLFDRFTQLSAVVHRTWQRGERAWELLLIPARANDVGKPNTRFPGRVTIYPEENHLLVKLGMRGAGFGFTVWGHPHDLETDTTDVGESFSRLENDSFDLGANLEWRRTSHRLAGAWGVDYFGRRGVSSFERIEHVAGGVDRIRALDDASEDEAAAYGSLRWHLGATTWQAGARMTLQRQDNAGFERRSDRAASGFAGVVHPLAGGFELTANLGTGLRFPTLSERFFSGTTGRGGVIGNPQLEPERSLSLDLGMRWFGDRAFVAASVFHQDIDDYIERIEVAEDLLTFVNLTSGTLDGIEIEGFWQPDERWYVAWNGHLIDGESDDGTPLADVPSHRLKVDLRLTEGRWQGRLEYQLRAHKEDPGSGEKPIPGAHLVAASVRYRLPFGLAVQLSGRNLLDERYFNSADRRTSLAPGRSFGAGITWTSP
ncbi:MAG: TonB-dependent receptor [Acidobacteria bacterium]|nr:MAG: TonB-dependent receptor [Acidobacteriota bacterium]